MRNEKYLTGREITQRSLLAALFGMLLAVIANAHIWEKLSISLR